MEMAGHGQRGSRENYPQLDLTGKLIIKMQLGDDIRRIPIHNEDITYDELVLMMQRVFRGRLDSKDEITLKYRDEDDDLITISDSSELSFAIQCSRILRLVIFVNSLPRPLEGDDLKHIRKELQDIRNRVNTLLDSLEPPALTGASSLPNGDLDTDVAMTTTSPGAAKMSSHLNDSKEFDPLSQKSEDGSQNKVMSSFGISSEASHRPTSPAESNSSVGSSASNQVRGGQHNALPGQPPQQQQPASQAQFVSPQGYPGYQQSPQPGKPGHPQHPAGYPVQSQQQQQPGVYMAAGQADPGQYPYSSQAQQPGAPQPAAAQPGAPGQYPTASQSQQHGYQAYQQGTYNAPPGHPSPVPPQQYGGYAQAGQAAAPGAAPGNPYSRGPSYGGQYPRPQGQYPNAGYQQ